MGDLMLQRVIFPPTCQVRPIYARLRRHRPGRAAELTRASFWHHGLHLPPTEERQCPPNKAA